MPTHLASTASTQHQERSFQGVQGVFCYPHKKSERCQLCFSGSRRQITEVAQLIDILIWRARTKARRASLEKIRSVLVLQLPEGDLRSSAEQIVAGGAVLVLDVILL